MKSFFETKIQQGALKISPALRSKLLHTALKLQDIDEAGKKWSKKNYENGYTSYGSLSKLHYQFSDFDSLKKALDKEVQKYTRKLGMQFDSGRLELTSLWVNIMPKNCYHAFHFHPLSVISGTYYLQTFPDASPIRFEDPRSQMFMASPSRKIQVDLKPKNGEVILFESWLKHEVPPHSSSKDRVSVSFNYDWIDR